MQVNKKNNILFILPQLKSGGSENTVLDLALNFKKRGDAVFVISFCPGPLIDKFANHGVRVFCLTKKYRFDVLLIYKIYKIIITNNIKVVNAHHYISLFYSFFPSCLSNTRLIYTEHSTTEVDGIYHSFHRYLFEKMLRHVHLVVGVSDKITKSFIKKYQKSTTKFVTVYNSVDLEVFESCSKRNEVRSLFGINKENYVIGIVANFRMVKNHLCLVKAFSKINKIQPHARLLFVGTGFDDDNVNSEKTVRQLITQLNLTDKVIFAGYQDDVPAMLSAMDAFCLPSFSEGFPVSLLEALSTGLICIGSDVTGVSEIISDNETGFLFNSDDDGELSEILNRVINGSYDQMRIQKNARRLLEHQFSHQAWINNIKRAFWD
ncbi:glycosyl transferase family 1 [Desulfosarcina alkanivorans]|uniref:Glycosyl transferase family 1 n=1 Tax=Desulfosarcina alkanivorans TaxID=571177 RepID=A0A5K7YCU1_9BACT|nr:glycosyltransferase [Desulfosarcina alkanivorans]BBO67272.1 glycosyl transferase family 1 [Desulfosarcina alkanivorans]